MMFRLSLSGLLIVFNHYVLLGQGYQGIKLGNLDKLILDGRLDESFWKKSQISSFLYFKDNPKLKNTQSSIHFTYDNEFLYLGIGVEGSPNNHMIQAELPKDSEAILSNEWVAVSLDTYNDGITAYTFIVDRFGNQFDGTLNAAKDLSNSFSIDWFAESYSHPNGFQIEIKIPIQDLPFPLGKNPKIGVLYIYNSISAGREFQFPFIEHRNKNQIDQFHPIELIGLEPKPITSTSGIDISKRLAYKKDKIQDFSTLVGRAQGGDASIMDYYLFKKRTIPKSDISKNPLNYSVNGAIRTEKAFMNTNFLKTYYPKVHSFDNLMERSQTTALIVLHKDTVLLERYYNGYNKDSVVTSFSVAKSITSILVGLAVQEGSIKSLDDKLTDYIPELAEKDPKFNTISLKDLLTMRSGLRYDDSGFPSDDDYTYIAPDLRSITLEKIELVESPGKTWKYNNYNLILLGMILERATGKNVSDFLKYSLWDFIGESDASWSLDEEGFEKMESGFNAIPMDYARLGLMMLNQGFVDNRRIISPNWVEFSTQPSMDNKPEGDFFVKNNLYYQYLWWGKKRPTASSDFFAMGNKGQYIYIIPSKNLVIVRLGFEYGLFTPATLSWPALFYELGEILP
ncbi:serine hydrolase [Algoriphagus sp. AK58]|uniref:serine hydrolase n=1 Tax=Algoriphagus sp. AK58 TaxID=1406877 RepID=UPI0016501B2E|nr:serine hydrolase [Algoriphagus sp. AK58]MBC6365839.1 hypothetical protein [Algoriphagus sp. AK58]